MLDKDALIYSLSANPKLGDAVAELLGVKKAPVHIAKFPSQEILVCPEESVRGKRIYIIQSTCPPVNENLMEVLIFIDSLKRASAEEITVIIPYFGYARQDRKSKPREPITSKLVANMLSIAGANRVITFDLHAAQLQGYFDCIEDDLSAIPMLSHVIYNDPEVDHNNLVVVSPDHGGVNRARRFAEKFNAPLAIIDKRRNSKYQPEVMNIIGDVNGKDCIIVDDMIDTAGSAVAAANALKGAGAKKIFMTVTHPVLSDPAYERLSTSKAFEKLYVTDSIPLPEKFVNSKDVKIQVESLAHIIAQSILAIDRKSPISDVYDMYKD